MAHAAVPGAVWSIREGALQLSLPQGSRVGGGGVLEHSVQHADHTPLPARSPLRRAVGGLARCVVDLTFGLGTDAMLLARSGLTVLACEISPPVLALAVDGLRRAAADPDASIRAAAQRICVLACDAVELLRQPSQAALPAAVHRGSDAPAYVPAANASTVVYIDPMFPAKRRADALPPKAAQVLQAVLRPNDQQAAEQAATLLAAARAAGFPRILLKRPDDAPPLAGLAPVGSVAGRAVRYDLYTGVSGPDRPSPAAPCEKPDRG